MKRSLIISEICQLRKGARIMADPSEHLRLIKYTVLQSTVVPSLLCDLLVFFYLIRHWRKELFAAPQNHVTLALLIISFIQKTVDIPLFLHYLRWGIVFQQSSTFCTMWAYIDYVTLAVSVHLVMWCSLERHLFVFHGTMMKKRRCLILFHYIPLMVTGVYAPLFYAFVVLLPTVCANVWDYTLPLCGAACYIFLPALSTVDSLFHCVLPLGVIVGANALLLTRFVWQKTRHQRRFQWNRQHRLISQLVFISILYLIFSAPFVTVVIIQTLWIPGFLIEISYDYFVFLAYFPNLLLPFAIIGSLPKMRNELHNWMLRVKRSCRYPKRTHPMLVTSVADGHRPNVAIVAMKSYRWHLFCSHIDVESLCCRYAFSCIYFASVTSQSLLD